MTTLSELVQDVYYELGQSEPIFAVTDGSVTTAIDGNRQYMADPPDADRNKNDYLAVVSAGGAAPEGEWSLITTYNDGTFTYTINTLTAALAAGDEVMILKQSQFKLLDVIRAINNGFQTIGDIPYIDKTSLDTASEQTEYEYPVTLKRNPPVAIYVQGETGDSNDNEPEQVPFRYEPALGGSTGLLYLPQLTAGRDIYLCVNTVHPDLTDYDDVLYEGLNKKLVVEAAIVNLLMRVNSGKKGKDDFWVARENDARKEVERLRMQLKPWRPKGARYARYGYGSYGGYPGDQSIYDRV